MSRSDAVFSGVVAHVSKHGTEIRFEGSPRRYQSPKGKPLFRRFVPGDTLSLTWGDNFPESLRVCKILAVQYRSVR